MIDKVIFLYKKVRFLFFIGLTFRSVYKNFNTIDTFHFDTLEIIPKYQYYKLSRSENIFLHYVYNNRLDIVKQFIRNGFTFHRYSSFPLELAAARGHTDIIAYLISKNSYIYENNSTFYDDTISIHPPLDQAVQYNKIDTFHYLLKHTPVADVHIYRSFIFACKYNSFEIIKYFLATYPKLSLLNYYHHHGINVAAKNRYDHIVEFFVEQGESLTHIEKFEDKKYYESYFCLKELNNTLPISGAKIKSHKL